MFNHRSYKIFSLVIGILLISLIVYLGGKGSIKQILDANLFFLLCSALVTILLVLTTSIRWGVIVNTIENKKVVSYFDCLYYLLLSRTFGLVGSQLTGDIGGRTLILKLTKNVKLKNGLLSVFIDRFQDLFLLIVLVVLTILYLQGTLNQIITLFLYIIILPIYLLLFTFSFNKLFGFTLNLFSSGLHKINEIFHCKKIADWKNRLTSQSQKTLFSKDINFRISFLTLSRFFLIVFQFYFISESLSTDISFVKILFSIPIAQLSFLIALTPGGLGIYDFGWYGVLYLLGVPEGQIIPFVIGQRIFLIVFTLFLTTVIYSIYNLFPKIKCKISV